MKTFASKVGWLLIVLTVVSALYCSVELAGIRRVQDYGIHAAHTARTLLWLLPLSLLLAGGLLFWSRREWRGRVSPRLYWPLLGVPVLVWGAALWHLYSHPVVHRVLSPEMQKIMDAEIEKWESNQTNSPTMRSSEPPPADAAGGRSP